MSKWIIGLFSVVLASGAAHADVAAPAPSAKDLTKAVEKVNYVETDLTGVKLGGYVDAGYTYNFYNGANKNRSMNDNQNFGDFNVNQIKLTLQKDLSDKNEWQAGFRADLFLGEDFAFANGSEGSSSDFFLKQAYVTFRAPVGNGLDFKVGKFASWIGYEMTDRPGNLNITWSDLFYLTPGDFTGVSAEYRFNDIVDGGLAVVNGMCLDSNPAGLGAENDGYGVMAKLNFKVPGGNANWQHTIYYSWDSANEFLYNDQRDNYRPGFSSSGNEAMYDGIMNWVPKFANGKLLLGATYDLGAIDGLRDQEGFTFAGTGLYAKYQFTDLFSLAGRGTYVHTTDELASDLWSITLTAGFNVAENLTIRTEYRFDLGDDRIMDYSNGITHNSGHTAAVEVVYAF
ncbi:MAG: porin [Verrucomicrobiales bacterium]|jgi:hypothetical protein|nr:porin [Verrucomicrobiales bacterium]